jgi:hypothetical protein
VVGGAVVTTTSLVNATAARADVLQNSADNSSDGWYPDEAQLAPSTVTSGDFGELFSTQVVGDVYAEPLVSQGTLLVATQEDNVYGLDASSGAIQWHDDFGPSADPLDQIGCGDIGSNVGVTGTPVIDPATDIAYFVAATGTGSGGAMQFFMDAVNVQTGATPAGWPAGGVPIQGSADDDPNAVFNPQQQTQRAGLVLVNGVVYAAFSSECDYGDWDGWMFGVSEATASITTVWATETGINASPGEGTGEAGIWQSGTAPVVDSHGDIFFATGNGNIPAGPEPDTDTSLTNFGESVVELSTSGGRLHVVDWFIPADAATLNTNDGDLGSGGVVALPASMGTPQEPNVLLADGKEGVLYALNMNALGGYQQGPGGSDAVPFESGPNGGVWARPAVWPGDGGYVYVPTAGTVAYSQTGGSLLAYQREVSASGAVWFQEVANTANSGNAFGFGGSAPVVTSDGTTSGSSLVWIVHSNDASGAGADLEAYDPIPEDPGPNGTLQEVWHSATFTSATFAQPSIDDGRIYVGTRDQTVLGFGLLPASPPALAGDDVDFPPTTVSQSYTETATFTAVTSTTVSSFSEAGAAFSLGTPDEPLPAELAPGQSITVPVTFTPNALGTLSGTLTANLTSGTAVVALTGDGLSATSPINAAPSAVDFPAQPIGGTAVSQLVTFTNDSGAAVTITGFDAPASPFNVALPPADGTLGPGDQVTFTVSFSPPGSSGDFVHVFGGVATLETSAGDFGVPLSGSADPPAQINIDPTDIDVGDVDVGSTATASFNVGDQGGEPLTIEESTPPMTNGFSATTSLPVNTVIGADSHVEESVSFTPTSPGPVSATWLIEGNDASGVQTITFTGTGVTPPPAPPPGPPPSSGSSGSGSSGSSGSSPSPPATLTITSLTGRVGSPLALRTSGDDAGGLLTFHVVDGTASGCHVEGAALDAASAGTCVVTATRAANGEQPAVSSSATVITFQAQTVAVAPASVTVAFAAHSSDLTTTARHNLSAFLRRLKAGAVIVCTVYSENDGALARQRAAAVVNFVTQHASVRVSVRVAKSPAANKATLTRA